MNFKYIYVFIIVLLLAVNTSCVVPLNKNNATTVEQKNTTDKSGRTENRTTTTNKNENAKPNQSVGNTNKARTDSRDAKDITNENNIVAVKKENLRSKKGQNATSEFERRKNALKNIKNETERFIDTTYYLLTMENGTTNISPTMAAATSDSKEYYMNLVTSFNTAIKEFENSTSLDCSVFKMFSNKFNFNDSLKQEADFYYSECCISNNNLEEAKFVLETLVNTKLNQAVAPKIIVRLGQLCCINGDTKQADKYFKRLKKEFPRSVYNQLADCSRL